MKSEGDYPAIKDNLAKQPNKRQSKSFRLKQGLFTKLAILSLAIGRCVTAKSIDGLTIENEIKKENPTVD